MNQMKKELLLLCALALGIGQASHAVIAKRGILQVTQPDGSVVNVQKAGDECCNFTLTPGGHILAANEAGVYEYAVLEADGSARPGGVKATLAAPSWAVTLADVDTGVLRARAEKRRTQSYARPLDVRAGAGATATDVKGIGLAENGYPLKGSPKGLVILVEYTDIKFTHPDPARYFGDMMHKTGFSEYGGTGCAQEYFTLQSQGQFTPSFDVYGPVTLPQNRKYYGGNSAAGSDQRPEYMAAHAVQALDATVDFSQYDTDGDGLIDNVFIFYAGQGEASYGPAESVWPHSWDVRYGGINLKVDGVTLGHYACSNEWEQNRPDGVGTFVHEFSHVMGLPDLYDTDGSLTCTPGAYSALDYGPYNNSGCTPPNYGGYERNACGWANPLILDQPETLTLDNVVKGNFAVIPTSKNTEFFILENRQQEGWDAYIPGHGLLIWHIDYNSTVFRQNSVNNSSSHQYVDIVEANGTPRNTSYATMAGWTFPGTAGKTSFTSTTTPALKAWDGTALDCPITAITENGGMVTFDVKGGGERLGTPVHDTQIVTGDSHFVASWSPVTGATEYFVTVTSHPQEELRTETAGFDGSALPQGWDLTATPAWYTTNTNYGQSSPSLKLSGTATLTSPAVTSSIKTVSFWHKGQGTKITSTLDIDALYDNGWKNVGSASLKVQAAGEEEIELEPGAHRIRLVFTKSSGNVAIDDVTLTVGEVASTLPEWDNTSTGTATKAHVNVPAGGNYSYVVTATDGRRYSTSERKYVQVGTNAVDNIATDVTDTPARYFDLQGVPVTNPAPGRIYIEVRGTTARKVRF